MLLAGLEIDMCLEVGFAFIASARPFLSHEILIGGSYDAYSSLEFAFLNAAVGTEGPNFFAYLIAIVCYASVILHQNHNPLVCLFVKRFLHYFNVSQTMFRLLRNTQQSECVESR